MTMESAAPDAEVARGATEADAEARRSLQPDVGVAIAAGRDVLGVHADDNDRLAAFTTPLIARLQADARPRQPRSMRVLVVMPTREIAGRIEAGLRQTLEPLALTSLLVQGGADYTSQAEAMEHGVDVLVATTGRLLDHIAKGTALLEHVELLIVDGADRMRDIRFLRDVNRIVEGLPGPRQTLLLSSIWTDDLREFAAAILRDPMVVEVRSPTADLEGSGPRNTRPQSRRNRSGQQSPRDSAPRDSAPRDSAPPQEDRRPRERDRQPISHESSLFPSSGPVFGYGDNRGGGNRRTRGGSGRRGGNY
jgi:ATP-dependent RNA helicase RhlE